MGLISFYIDFSNDIILSVLPLFLVNNLEISRTILGAIEGSSELTSYVFRLFSGALSDKFRKRKIFIIIGYGLSTISKNPSLCLVAVGLTPLLWGQLTEWEKVYELLLVMH